MAPTQEIMAITAVPDTPAIMMSPTLTTPAATNLTTITETEYDLSVLLVQPSTNESQLGASYLNNWIHQAVQNTSISICSSDLYVHENLKSLLDEGLNDKIYNKFKETFSNTNLDSVCELSPKV